MQKENRKSSINTLIPSIIDNGYFSDKLPRDLFDYIIKSVYVDILKKISSFKDVFINESNNLEEQITNTLPKLTNTEFKELFGPLHNRYLAGNTVAIDMSEKIRGYFHSLYGVNLYLHGIRPSDRKKILPNIKESSTAAIWYRIYPPNSECGLPHRDFDFWQIDEVAEKPIENSARIKFWMPIYGCNNKNSLRIWPKSHKLDIKSDYTAGKRILPYINPENLDKCGDFITPAYSPKDYILFDDLTVHHGPKNKNNKYGFRISLETTLFLDSNLLENS